MTICFYQTIAVPNNCRITAPATRKKTCLLIKHWPQKI